jgi:hypothetical protein
MKPDESTFFRSLRALDGETPHIPSLIQAQGLNEKRAVYLLDKWEEKGWYEYGVSVLYGWLTPEGEAAAEKMAGG